MPGASGLPGSEQNRVPLPAHAIPARRRAGPDTDPCEPGVEGGASVGPRASSTQPDQPAGYRRAGHGSPHSAAPVCAGRARRARSFLRFAAGFGIAARLLRFLRPLIMLQRAGPVTALRRLVPGGLHGLHPARDAGLVTFARPGSRRQHEQFARDRQAEVSIPPLSPAGAEAGWFQTKC